MRRGFHNSTEVILPPRNYNGETSAPMKSCTNKKRGVNAWWVVITISLFIIGKCATGNAAVNRMSTKDNANYGHNFQFSRPFNCGDRKALFDLCVINSYQKNTPILLLGNNSDICQAAALNNINYYFEAADTHIPATLIQAPEACYDLSLYSLALVGETILDYKILPIEINENPVIANQINSMIKERHILKPIASYKPYVPDESMIPMLYIFPHPSAQILIAKYDVVNKYGPTIIVFENRGILLDEICLREMKAFSLNGRYFLAMDYGGCDSGVVGVAIYEVTQYGVKKVFADETWSL